MQKYNKEQSALKQSPWLHAWSDHVAGVTAYSPLMSLIDLKDDNDHKLVIADLKQELKIYHGTVLIFKYKLEEVPSGITFIYQNQDVPRVPLIAISAANFIYFFLQFKRYFRYQAPSVPPNERQIQIWEEMKSGVTDVEKGTEQLYDMTKDGVRLNGVSSQLIHISSRIEQKAFIERNKDTNFNELNFITCMTSINKVREQPKSLSRLVFGTENRELHIFDAGNQKIIKTFDLMSVPMQLAVRGVYEVEYRVAIACRDGKVYIVKNHQLLEKYIEVQSMPVHICFLEQYIMIGSMQKVITALMPRGKKMYSIYLSQNIVSMVPMIISRTQVIYALLVALQNGEIRLYNEKQLITVIQAQQPVNGMVFGTYGRQDGSLVLNYKNGGLSVKILQRQTHIGSGGVKVGPPPEQDIPLNIPKKTKTFIQMTSREREQGISMHKIFQKDLCRMKLKTAQQYIKILDDGHAPMAYSGGSNVRINCSVNGLGPLFKIKAEVENTDKLPQYDLTFVIIFNQSFYRLHTAKKRISVLIPGMTYKTFFDIESIHPNGVSDIVRVLLCNKTGDSIPLVAANIQMPLSEPPDE